MKKWYWILIAMALLTGAEGVMAQISVDLQATRRIYVVHEPVSVVVAITNRAGRDIVLSNDGGPPWLTFQVKDNQGNLISSSRDHRFDPVIIPANQTLQRKIALNSYYQMTRKGLYRVEANVFFAPLGDYFRSQGATFQISDGRELWSQVVGVPEGQEGAGDFRRYSLMTFDTEAEKHIYCRVKDEDSGRVRTTYSLGQLIMVRKPTASIDRDNRLHVLHMAAPRTWAHSIVDVDGAFVSRDIYRETGGSIPQIVTDGVGGVAIVGGISEEEERAMGVDESVRKLSERPAGMPNPRAEQQGFRPFSP